MFDFIGKKKIFFSISIGIILVCLIINAIFGTELSINFKGGTIISYSLSEKAKLDDVKEIVKGVVNSNVTVTETKKLDDEAQKAGNDINISLASNITAEERDAITDAVVEKYGEDSKLVSFNTVPAIVGKSLFAKGFATVAISCLLMLVYLGFRFKNIGGWSAGLMGVVALIHDVILAYFAFVVFRLPLDDNFIAVILTIIGYSLNDTIVIFDRIRENRRKLGVTKGINEIVNISLNQTFKRSLNTSITTFIAVATISVVAWVSGVTSILSFSLPMCIGVISGCYSSVFIAAPLWAMWKNRKNKVKA